MKEIVYLSVFVSLVHFRQDVTRLFICLHPGYISDVENLFGIKFSISFTKEGGEKGDVTHEFNFRDIYTIIIVEMSARHIHDNRLKTYKSTTEINMPIILFPLFSCGFFSFSFGK